MKMRCWKTNHRKASYKERMKKIPHTSVKQRKGQVECSCYLGPVWHKFYLWKIEEFKVFNSTFLYLLTSRHFLCRNSTAIAEQSSVRDFRWRSVAVAERRRQRCHNKKLFRTFFLSSFKANFYRILFLSEQLLVDLSWVPAVLSHSPSFPRSFFSHLHARTVFVDWVFIQLTDLSRYVSSPLFYLFSFLPFLLYIFLSGIINFI